MLEYYENRQSEYESIYSKPERQEDLAWLSDQLQKFTTDSNVFELACGTGYWTRRMVAYASSVHATDLSPQLVTAALASCIGGKSSGSTIDAFNLPENLESAYDCLVAGFLFSHILIEQRQSFLKGIVKAIGAGARLVLFDNR
ncbi:MAG: phospholipid N-methyltransferase, partial [Parasphingorhabdus sp.]